MPSNEVVTKTREIMAEVRRKAVSKTTYLKLFTQTPAGEPYAVLDSNGVAGGICCALSLYWLAARANGTDYVDELLGPGGTIKEDAIKPAIDLQKAMSNPDTQLAEAKKWLENKGFSGSQKPTTQVMNNVGSWYCGPYSGGGPYRLLGMRGYNHATALDLSNQSDLAFFDPNLGGFHFNSLQNLKDFLDTMIFQSSGDKWGNTEGSYLGRKRFSLVEMGGFNHS